MQSRVGAHLHLGRYLLRRRCCAPSI